MNDEIGSHAANKVKLTLNIASIGVLLAGMGIGMVTLAAAAGIWLGLWDFRRGFDLLRISNNYGDIIAWIGLFGTIAIVVAARLFDTGNAVRLGGLAAIGTLTAFVAYSIPESFRPAEGINYPPPFMIFLPI